MFRTISLIHPSRGRVSEAFKAGSKWIRDAGEPVEYILSIDYDDPHKGLYQAKFLGNGLVCDRSGVGVGAWRHDGILESGNRSAVDAINNAAKHSTSDIIVVMSDDFDCPPQWATALLRLTEGKTDWIAKTPDGIQKWIITLPIMDRTYYNRFGYIYYPEYRHMFCDTEMTCVGDLLQKTIKLDIPFKHNHYSTGASKKDPVSERADSTWGQGEALFIERARKNFDLIDPPGKIMEEAYNNWIRRKL